MTVSTGASDAGSSLDAGEFGPWLRMLQGALRGENATEVPCGTCTACCTASQFIHIGPEETDALAHIPRELLFAAPRLPPGHVLMGYDRRGHCPMLVDGACSIYAHRPRTCRTYDCRVFTAAGLEPDEPDKETIAGQARRWRFAFADDSDRVLREAVRAAAAFLGRRDVLPEAGGTLTTTQRAVLAVDVSDLFLGTDSDTGARALIEPDASAVRVELTRRARRGGETDD